MKFVIVSDDKTPLKSNRKLIDEIFIFLSISLFLSLVFSSITLVSPFKSEEMISLTYSYNKEIKFSKNTLLFSILFSFVDIIVFYLSAILIRPSKNNIIINKKFKNVIFLSILSLFGNLAYIVISMLFSSLNKDIGLCIFISSFFTNMYLALLYKLYLENMSYSNHLFYEIMRFIIVGLVAAVFDFLVCYLFQFVVFKGNDKAYVTIISTICGFIIGVVINYLLSTYMVYKKSDNKKAKDLKGIIIFVVLAVIGLLLGILIQYLLYDLLFIKKNVGFFNYPVVFIIRTLIVMVYNYISRKLILYK